MALIEKGHPESAFELAIGSSYPFAEKLSAASIDVASYNIFKGTDC
jgi:hypothetical protein